MRRSGRLQNRQKLGAPISEGGGCRKGKAAGGGEGSKIRNVPKKVTAEKNTVAVTALWRGEKKSGTNHNEGKESPSTSKAAAAAQSNEIDAKKRPCLSTDQRTILDADIQTPVSGNNHEPFINSFNMEHVVDCIFTYIFPGSESENYNLKDICNFRLVCQTWNKAGGRLLRKHCRIAVGSANASDQSGNSNAPEHDFEEKVILSTLPITINLHVEKIQQFTSVMKNSHDVPFSMFSLREGLFSEENTKVVIELLQICGPFMEQLLVTMEQSTCKMSFLTPHFQLNTLKRLKLMMKHSKTDYNTNAARQFTVSDRIYPIDGINGIYFLQALCNGAVALDRLDIHWTPIPWSSTFGLKDLFLPKTVTKLTVDTMNTDGITVKNLLLHTDLNLTILKWSIALPLQSLSSDDIKMCLKRHSETLRSLYFSIWISRLHHDEKKVVDFPPMPNVEQLSLMGNGSHINPFSFPTIFPKLSSLTLYSKMLDFLSEVAPSKTVKVVRIFGTPICCDFRNIMAKAFLELQTLILFPQEQEKLLSKDYLVPMFDLMSKLQILLSRFSSRDATTETINSASKEEDLPNDLHLVNLPSIGRHSYIVRTKEVTPAVAEAFKHLESISRNPPFTLNATVSSYL